MCVGDADDGCLPCLCPLDLEGGCLLKRSPGIGSFSFSFGEALLTRPILLHYFALALRSSARHASRLSPSTLLVPETAANRPWGRTASTVCLPCFRGVMELCVCFSQRAMTLRQAVRSGVLSCDSWFMMTPKARPFPRLDSPPSPPSFIVFVTGFDRKQCIRSGEGFCAPAPSASVTLL